MHATLLHSRPGCLGHAWLAGVAPKQHFQSGVRTTYDLYIGQNPIRLGAQATRSGGE